MFVWRMVSICHGRRIPRGNALSTIALVGVGNFSFAFWAAGAVDEDKSNPTLSQVLPILSLNTGQFWRLFYQVHCIGNFGASCEFWRHSLEKATEIHHNSQEWPKHPNCDRFWWVFQGKSSEFAWIPGIPYPMRRSKKSPTLLVDFSQVWAEFSQGNTGFLWQILCWRITHKNACFSKLRIGEHPLTRNYYENNSLRIIFRNFWGNLPPQNLRERKTFSRNYAWNSQFFKNNYFKIIFRKY